MIRWALPLFAAMLMLATGFAGPQAGPVARGQPLVSAATERPEASTLLHRASDLACPPSTSLPEGGAAQADKWAVARLWLGTLQGWPDSDAVQAWRRFVRWTKANGTATAATPGCPAAN